MDANRKPLLYGLLVAAVAIVVAGLVLAGGEDTTGPAATTATPSEPVNKDDGQPKETKDPGADRKPAPDIAGNDVTNPGKSIKLSDFEGKPVVVQVWASWCPICNDEAPEIAAFQKANPDVEFIGVNVEDTQSDALAYKERHGLKHEFDINDLNREVEGELGFTGQPNSMVIDDKGRIVEIFPGSVTQAQLEAALDQI